jgi:acyl carrier protein
MSTEQLRALVADALNVAVEDVGDDVRFDTLPDYDSVARLALLMALADANIEIPMSHAADFQTFRELRQLASGIE